MVLNELRSAKRAVSCQWDFALQTEGSLTSFGAEILQLLVGLQMIAQLQPALGGIEVALVFDGQRGHGKAASPGITAPE
jgi:hypothetical protein